MPQVFGKKIGDVIQSRGGEAHRSRNISCTGRGGTKVDLTGRRVFLRIEK